MRQPELCICGYQSKRNRPRDKAIEYLRSHRYLWADWYPFPFARDERWRLIANCLKAQRIYKPSTYWWDIRVDKIVAAAKL